MTQANETHWLVLESRIWSPPSVTGFYTHCAIAAPARFTRQNFVCRLWPDSGLASAGGWLLEKMVQNRPVNAYTYGLDGATCPAFYVTRGKYTHICTSMTPLAVADTRRQHWSLKHEILNLLATSPVLISANGDRSNPNVYGTDALT